MLSLVVQTPTLECNGHCVSFSLIILLICVMISSPIVRTGSQVQTWAQHVSWPPSHLPQTKEMFMGVSWLILKLREVSSLSMGTIYSFQKRSSDQTYVNKHKQTWKRSVTGHLTHHMISYLIWCHES